MNEYEQKLEQKKSRFLDLAASARAESNTRYTRAKSMADCIPFGQPILVGHYSERRDRNFRGKINNNFRKAFEAQDKAAYYEQRAENVGSGGISSDDPDAVDKLKAKLANLQASQDAMKAANKIIRSKKLDDAGKVAAMEAAGIPDAARLLKPDYAGRIGFASYSLQNNGANMKRIEQRINELERKQAAPEVPPQEYEGFEVIREDNRIQFIFDGKPAAEIRDVLKRNAFKWSPTRGAWVRQQTGNAEYAAQCIIKELSK